jgi:hypothetical protein
MLMSGQCTAESRIQYLEDCKSDENTSSEIHGGDNEPDNTPDYGELAGSLGASECIHTSRRTATAHSSKYGCIASVCLCLKSDTTDIHQPGAPGVKSLGFAYLTGYSVIYDIPKHFESQLEHTAANERKETLMLGDIPYMQLITPMNRTRNRRAMDCWTNQNNNIRPTNPRMRIQVLKEQDSVSDSASDLVHPN